MQVTAAPCPGRGCGGWRGRAGRAPLRLAPPAKGGPRLRAGGRTAAAARGFAWKGSVGRGRCHAGRRLRAAAIQAGQPAGRWGGPQPQTVGWGGSRRPEQQHVFHLPHLPLQKQIYFFRTILVGTVDLIRYALPPPGKSRLCGIGKRFLCKLAPKFAHKPFFCSTCRKPVSGSSWQVTGLGCKSPLERHSGCAGPGSPSAGSVHKVSLNRVYPAGDISISCH